MDSDGSIYTTDGTIEEKKMIRWLFEKYKDSPTRTVG